MIKTHKLTAQYNWTNKKNHSTVTIGYCNHFDKDDVNLQNFIPKKREENRQ